MYFEHPIIMTDEQLDTLHFTKGYRAGGTI